MECRCGLGSRELVNLRIPYYTTSWDELYCFRCFTCSNCGARGSEIGGTANILKTVPVLCTNCYVCPCGKTSKIYAYLERYSRMHYFCSIDCEAFYTMQYGFFLFIFALKEQRLQRLFRHLLPRIFHEVKKMPKYRCVDCWKEFYYSKPLCADCGSTKCHSMLELQEIWHIKERYYSKIVFSRYSQWELRSNENITICGSCEMRRPSPRCLARLSSSEITHCRFANNIYRENHAPKKVVAVKPRVLKKPKNRKPKNRNPKSHSYVPKKQNWGRKGNFKKNYR